MSTAVQDTGAAKTAAGAAEPQVDDEQEQPPPPPLYPTLEAWVSSNFWPMFLHRVPETPRVRWCLQWWNHTEAIVRLHILWQGWEAARQDASLKAGWWLDLDHHLPILMGIDGPFRNCRPVEGKHMPTPAPPVEFAPEGWWD